MTPPSGWRDSYFEDGYLRRWRLTPADQLEAERAAAYLTLSGAPVGARALDLGCGHGKYAIPLAAVGYRVVGFDASRALLRRAQSDAARAGNRVSWVRGDMRSLPFGCAFDVVLILDAFGYFDADGEDLALLLGLRDVLREEGRVLMRNPNGARIRAQFHPTAEEIRDDSTTRIRNELAGDGRWLHQDVTIEQQGSTHSYQRRQRIYAAEELGELMHQAGFSVFGHYADASGASFDALQSSHVVTVSAKR